MIKSSNLAPTREAVWWRRALDHTSMYGFELFMAAFGLTVAAVVVDYGLFALFNYLIDLGNESSSRMVDEFSLWIVAAMLVWLPLALGFYFRVKGEQSAKVDRAASRLHKTIVSLYLFFNILLLVGAVFTALYSLIRLAVGDADDTVLDMLVRITLPALLMAALHGWLLMAFSPARFLTRKLFGLSFAVVSLSVVLLLLVTSFGAVRGAALDTKRQNDLTTISRAVRDYYSQNQTLPASLDDLKFDKKEPRLPLSEYSYQRQLGARYELCADFARDTRSDNDDGPIDEYSSYDSFYEHDSGRDCFKLTATARDHDILR